MNTDCPPARPGKLFVRADADGRMGIGHVIRCMALAQAWRGQGGDVVFISNGLADSLADQIAVEGFSMAPVSGSHPSPSDPMETMRIVEAALARDSGASWLVIDGYHFDPDYQRSVKRPGVATLAVDDNHHLPFYDVDAIINPNLYGPAIDYQCEPGTLLLLGGKFSLLRSEFRHWDSGKKETPETVKNIFVILGGGDAPNVTLKVLDALNFLTGVRLNVKTVVGHVNPNLESLAAAAGRSHHRVELIPSVEDMPSLMDWADIAITAAGQTCLELACMGTPAITIVTAENQETAAALFGKKKIFDSMGWWNRFSAKELAEKIIAMMENPAQRRKRSHNGRREVSIMGADNCVSAMLTWNRKKAR